MGMGMIREECYCEEEPVVIDKESKAYRDSIAKIMKASRCSRVEAEKTFAAEFDKIA